MGLQMNAHLISETVITLGHLWGFPVATGSPSLVTLTTLLVGPWASWVSGKEQKERYKKERTLKNTRTMSVLGCFHLCLV